MGRRDRIDRSRQRRFPAGLIAVAGPIFFDDGTWVDESDKDTIKYGVDQTTLHGNPGVKLEYEDPGPQSVTERRIILRLETTVTIETTDVAVFNFFIGQIVAEFIGAALNPNVMILEVGLLTVSLADAVLQAMTWNNQPAPVEVFTVGELIVDAKADGRYRDPTSGGPLIGNRFSPASQRVVTGVLLRFQNPSGSGDDSTGFVDIRRTRVGDPQRSFILIQ